MMRTVKKVILCSLVVSLMQYGLSVPLIKAAEPRNNNQQQDQYQQEKERQDKQRQEQQRQDKQRQDQQRQDKQRQEQQLQDKQRQDQQRQEQQHQDRQRQDQRQQNQKRHDWSNRTYQDYNWHRTNSQYSESMPFRWHEPRNSIHERFSPSEYRMELIQDREWNDRFRGLHSYRWHDNDSYNQGYLWYRGVRIRDAVLFYDDEDELVGVGFTFGGSFVFIRDDQEEYQHNDSLLLVLAILMLTR